MYLTSWRITSLALLTIVVVTSIVGCDQIRKVTYSGGFTYLDEEEVETLMQKMGESMTRLDQLVAETSPSDDRQQRDVIAELNRLEGFATSLSGGHTQTNQFLIDKHIEGFISDIGTAKMFAGMNPPKYYKVEYVTQSCVECHQLR